MIKLDLIELKCGMILLEKKYMKEIVRPLLKWYQKNKRKLPWREDLNPYHVWISEVMLQQTRIEAVIPYYDRFIKQLPTIYDLAKVDDDKLLKLWEGLGYYNRARNLKKAAMEVVLKYNGNFPNSFEKILALPGIGEYTASAISSICFSLPEVTIDGNVLRVYERLMNGYDNIDEISVRKKIRLELMEIIPPTKSGEFNQSLMELGEIVCLPNGIPKCNICPLSRFCKAREKHTFLHIPVRNPKKEKKIQKFTVLLLICGDKIAIHKRGDKGVLKNLWEFPNVSGFYSEEDILQYLIDCSFEVNSIICSISYNHIFTHLKWQMQSYLVRVANMQSDYSWVNMSELLNTYALPSAFQPFVKEIEKEVRK